MGDNKINVALFGGSFNPPHVGHVQIVDHILRKGTFDQVWVIPCFRHPFGKKLAPFWDRIKMVRLAFAGFGERVRVTDVERRIGGVSYTWRTVRYLARSYPECQFAWVIGGDQDKEKWRDFDKIKKTISIEDLPRGPGSPIRDVSSSDIRDALHKGYTASDFVASKVIALIRRRKLFG